MPAVALAFGIWQFRVQRDKSKRPDVYFRNESERERKFLQRQATRRMQIGALIGLFGVFALVGLYHPLEFYPLVWGLALFAAILALGWAGALAFADVVAIRAHYGAELDLRRAERLALEYKIKKVKGTRQGDSGRRKRRAGKRTLKGKFSELIRKNRLIATK